MISTPVLISKCSLGLLLQKSKHDGSLAEKLPGEAGRKPTTNAEGEGRREERDEYVTTCMPCVITFNGRRSVQVNTLPEDEEELDELLEELLEVVTQRALVQLPLLAP